MAYRYPSANRALYHLARRDDAAARTHQNEWTHLSIRGARSQRAVSVFRAGAESRPGSEAQSADAHIPVLHHLPDVAVRGAHRRSLPAIRRVVHRNACAAIGRLRRRLPVAVKIALQIAGATGGTASSPIPPGAASP